MFPGHYIVVEKEGYYYSPDRAEIVEAEAGRILPPAEYWEYVGSAEDMSPVDVVAILEERYPDTAVGLTFHRL
ncbi:MAG: hypothetical protein K6U00_13140 [Armatimonadetes bacterium]|nr:hypothetical protein [Armatimonadota bacterium]